MLELDNPQAPEVCRAVARYVSLSGERYIFGWHHDNPGVRRYDIASDVKGGVKDTDWWPFRLSVVPIKLDGSKAPALNWKPLQSKRPKLNNLAAWFRGGRAGVGIVCGAISGNLLVLDFEEADAYDRWLSAVGAARPDFAAAICEELPLAETPGGGRHVYLRTDGPAPAGTKLAYRLDPESGELELIAETRGEGHYVIAPGSPAAVHPSGKPYVWLREPGTFGIPRLLAADVDFMLSRIAALDERPKAEATARAYKPATPIVGDDNRPGADYNRRTDMIEYLRGRGWNVDSVKGDETFLTRPGKPKGISASVGHCQTAAGLPRLYVWTSNAAPLEPGQSYDAFGLFAVYECGGDRIEAARKLAEKGYGEKAEPIKWKGGKRRLQTGTPTKGEGGDDTRQPVIIGDDEHRVVDECIAALATDPDLFQRDGKFVRVSENTATKVPVIEQVADADLRRRLTQVAALQLVVKDDEGNERVEPKHAPPWLVPEIASHPHKPGIRGLVGVSTTPIIRPDGSVRTGAGYDPTTAVMLCPGGVTFPAIPDKITLADVRKSVAELVDLFVNFPFAEPAGRSVFLSLIFSTLARHLIDGPVPLHLADANIRGAGKGLGIDVCGAIVLGGHIPTQPYSSNPEELRKVVTSVVMAGTQIMHLDNLPSGERFGNAALDSALTSTVWSDRMLGKNQTIVLPQRVVFCASGNNVQLVGDATRRIIRARLESKDAAPEDRQGFKYPELLKHVRANRAELLCHAVRVVAGYLQAGRPAVALSAAGSFDAWTGLIRAAIVWSGEPDPWATNLSMRTDIDVEVGEAELLVAAWDELAPDGESITTGEALRRYGAGGEFGCPETAEFLAAAGLKDFNARTIGKLLSKHAGRPLSDGRGIVKRSAGGGVKSWQVARIGQPSGRIGSKTLYADRGDDATDVEHGDQAHRSGYGLGVEL